jgi:hypothetical protein
MWRDADTEARDLKSNALIAAVCDRCAGCCKKLAALL